MTRRTGSADPFVTISRLPPPLIAVTVVAMAVAVVVMAVIIAVGVAVVGAGSFEH